MGNTPSKPPQPGGDSNANANYPATAGSQQNTYNDRRVNRRSSIQALSGTTGTGSKSSAADPSATRESATGHPIPHRQQGPVQHWLQSRNLPDSSRHDHHLQQQPQQRDSPRYQRETSDKREYLPTGYQREPSPEPSKAVRVPSAPDRGPGGANSAGAGTNVTRHYNVSGHREQYTSIEPSGPTSSGYYGASAHLSRPPRLPLPIGDATTTPGSPIVAPSSMTGPHAVVPGLIDRAELELSGSGEGGDRVGRTGLGDEDEEEEMIDELEADAGMGIGVGGLGVNKAVTTTIEWRGSGEKVYVTGTFVNWERKFRLHKSETEDGVKTATLQLRPGTHHLKFIVDGIMSTSDQLPTAVDFTNHLVNYIEVSPEPEELPRLRRESDRDRPPKYAIPPGLYPPQALPETLELHPDHDSDGDYPSDSSETSSQHRHRQQQRQPPEEEIPPGDFRTIIPPFLTDIDGEAEEDGLRYQQAANVIGDATVPPMLPIYLSKSILNITTPMKDDSSVLVAPSHTTLNHLATSSIKNGVLATSVSTRYRDKCVTTIVYKPTGNITG
ncbi:hypothetical protein GX51_02272 [Blastomyces parvus]|uniref:Association with the SNF1 complex (ASC) domain-containing protein n=1 Tax=Blastomyces parvus TaxID=2060905 RepID=A0A2B7X4R9_9EURO|nr:hypothetical protein GX51_02272 [Blastomyces parvus]